MAVFVLSARFKYDHKSDAYIRSVPAQIIYFLRLQLKVVFTMFQSANYVLRCIDSCVGVCHSHLIVVPEGTLIVQKTKSSNNHNKHNPETIKEEKIDQNKPHNYILYAPYTNTHTSYSTICMCVCVCVFPQPDQCLWLCPPDRPWGP